MSSEERLAQFEKMKKVHRGAACGHCVQTGQAAGRRQTEVSDLHAALSNKMTFENMLKLYELYDID